MELEKNENTFKINKTYLLYWKTENFSWFSAPPLAELENIKNTFINEKNLYREGKISHGFQPRL